MFPYVSFLGRFIPTYGLFMALGCSAAYLLALYRVRKARLNPDHLLIIAAVALGCGLTGAKLFYLLFSCSPAQLAAAFHAGDFSLLMGGGLVFYGGLIGGIAGALWGAKIAGTRLMDYEWAAVPCIPLGHAFGRLGCLAAGCCYGMPYSGPFAVHYPAALPGIPRGQGAFPVQPIEAIINLAVCGVLLAFGRRKRNKYDLLLLYLLLYVVERFCLEFLRGDLIRGVNAGLSSSQWISLAILSACAVFCAVRAGRARSV